MSKLNLQRPLRFALTPHDQIFFLHIPKTAGTSLNEVLSRRVHVDDWFTPTPNENKLSLEQVAERLVKAKLVHGHHDYRLKFSMRRPVVITFLRHPHKRILSTYLFLDRTDPQTMHRQMKSVDPEHDANEDISIESYIRLPHFYNTQTRMIGGFERAEMKTIPDDVLLQVAQVHLDAMPFFGITERFDDSIRLMNYVFGWPNNVNPPRLNVNPASQNQPLTPETEQALEETNRIDTALYTLANEMFERRFQQMLRETSAQS
jgi:hypothetical protein